jgi:hypothetical protein
MNQTAMATSFEADNNPPAPTAMTLSPRQARCGLLEGPYGAPVCPGIAEGCAKQTCTVVKTVTVPANSPPCPYTLTYKKRAVATCIPYCPAGCKTVVKTVAARATARP